MKRVALLLLFPFPSFGNMASLVFRAPEVLALHQEAEAARQRVDAAGRFPDPELEVMASRADTPEGEVPMYELLLRQPLPRRGERAAERNLAHSRAEIMDAKMSVMAGVLAAETAMASVEAETALARAVLLRAQAQRMRAVLVSVEARIGAGSGNIGDKLTLQSAIEAMLLMAEQEQRNAEDLQTEALARLGLMPDTPLPAFDPPDIAGMLVEQAPEFRLALARADEASAMARMARASAHPMTAVALRYEREEELMGDVDTLGVAFMTELPFRARSRSSAELSAAEAEIRAAEARTEGVRHLWKAHVIRLARAENFARRSRRIADDTRTSLDAESAALLRSAGVDGMERGMPILKFSDILERMTQTEILAINAEADARALRAALWRFVPLSPNPSNLKELP